MSSRGRRGRPRRGGNSSNSESSSGAAKRKLREEGSGFEAWGGYMQAKMQKLNDQFNKGEKGSTIFSGIHVYVNGYTKPSSDELRRLLTLHGGAYEQYLYRTRVTHIVATNLPDSKVRELKGMKVVRPEWITESVSAGRLLPYTSYQLYTAQTRLQHGLESFTKTAAISRTTSVLSTDSGTGECESSRLIEEDEGSQSDEEDLSNLRTKDMETEHNLGVDTHLRISGPTPKPTSLPAETLTGSYHDKSPNKKMAKAGDSNFLSEFYSHSRLHHISTWGAEYRAYVTQLQKQSDGVYPGRDRLRKFHEDNVSRTGVDEIQTGPRSGKPKKVIMHVDMDCFFVSVGLLDKPELRGRPIAVTHSRGKGTGKEVEGSDFNYEKAHYERKRQQGGKKGRRSTTTPTVQGNEQHLDGEEGSVESRNGKSGSLSATTEKETFHSYAEIASCSYEARKAGVKNGMFMGPAKQLCPDLVTIPYNFDKYQEVSRALYDTVASYTHDIEAVSCDEMLVDCTDLLADTGGTPQEFATLLRQEIVDKTGCCASAGISGSILLARLATRKAKPNGQYYLTRDEVPDFMVKQTIRDLPGVGYSMTRKLNTMGVSTCGDLQKLSLPQLQKEFGPKTGQSLYNYCRGQDERNIRMEKERKSVSAEINYGIRFTRDSEAEKFLCDLSEEVSTRLKNINMKGKTITLKVMVRRSDAPKETAKFMGHGICNNLSKSSSLPVATDDNKVIGKECVALLRMMKVKGEDLRGIGIQTHRLETATLGGPSAGGGNQSILSFAVPKTSPGNSRTTVSKPSTTSKVTNATPGRTRTSSDDVGYVDDLEGEGRAEEDEDEAIAISCSSGPIQEELSRKKTTRNELPPLPSLPSFGTPETPRSKTTVPTSEAGDYFPSPSQIDPEVLKELPPEIRSQIEKDMATKRKDSRATAAPANQNQEEVPGCSHWPSQENEAANEEEVDDSPPIYLDSPPIYLDSPEPEIEEQPGRVEALPSYSQLDLDCLNALPQDMQEEIRSEYARQQRQSDSEQIDTVPALHLEQAGPAKGDNSPRKSSARSPGRGNKKSPVFKVPRGRPAGRKNKKLSPKKLNFRSQTRLTHTAVVKNLERTLTEPAPTPEVAEPPPPEQPDPTPDEEEDLGVNLCGAVTIHEVRQLLAEWLEACPVPQEEDVRVMLEYLGQLVLDQNLEQVDLVLKFLNRKIRKLSNQLWRLSFKNILTNTQEVIRSVHGCNLAVDWLKS